MDIIIIVNEVKETCFEQMKISANRKSHQRYRHIKKKTKWKFQNKKNILSEIKISQNRLSHVDTPEKRLNDMQDRST